MKRIIPLLCLFLCGCTTVTQRPDGTFSVTSFLNKRTMDRLTYKVGNNQQGFRTYDLDVKGYASDQAETAQQLLDVASKALAAYLKTQTMGISP